MSRLAKKKNILVTVLVASIGIHVVGLLVLGLFRVVEEVSSPPPEFEAVVEDPEPPPPPPPPTTARSTQRSMPRPEPIAATNAVDIAVPQIEISSAEIVMGVSGRGGSGGFGIAGASQPSVGLFGNFDPFEGALEGTFYDTKQDSNGEPTSTGNSDYHDLVKSFADRAWNTNVLDDFFSPDTNLYTRQIFLPLMSAKEGPAHFGVGEAVEEKRWLIHYAGEFRPNRSTRFRFVGRAGEVLIVRFNRKIVLDASHTYLTTDTDSGGGVKVTRWDSSSNVDTYKTFTSGRWAGSETLVFGDWIEVREGVSYDLEILIGERGGGAFYSFLLYEEEDDPGEALSNGQYRLPIFTTDLGPAQPVEFDEGRQGPAVRQPR